jgi:hypothetical protein
MQFEQAGLLQQKPSEKITNNHSPITNNHFGVPPILVVEAKLREFRANLPWSGVGIPRQIG